MAAGIPDEEASEEEQDEWGGASTQDRSQTFLPIIRKFVGSVTVILVTLIFLSYLGINIAHLLAGGGVAAGRDGWQQPVGSFQNRCSP